MKRFKKAYIEITNVCNLNCKFCPKTSRVPRMMETWEFERVIVEVSQFTKFIYLHLMGEPLVCTKLNEFLKLADERGMNVNITTNGTLLKKNEEVLLNSKSLRKVSISLHSFETNDDLDDGTYGKKLDNYIDEVLEVSKKLSDNGQIAVLKLWNLDSNELKGENKLNNTIIEKIQNYFGVIQDLKSELSRKANVKLDTHVYIQTAEKFKWPNEKEKLENEKVFCYGLRDQFGILVDGTVVPCCLDSEGCMNLGNVFKEPLKDILYGEKANYIYDNITNGKAITKLCRNCDYAKRKRELK